MRSQVLRRHPSRTLDPSSASLFFVPVYEYTSYSIGDCNGTSHRERMEAAEAALRAEVTYSRNGGADHFFATSAWSISGSPLSLSSRMQPLTSALSCGGAGRYKQFPVHGPSTSSVAACTFEIPYQANLASSRLYRPPGDPSAPPRRTLLQFAGALDVCCTGRAIRCAIAPLYAAAMSGEISDVIVRPIVPTSLSGKPCTAKALQLAARAMRNRSSAIARGGSSSGRRLAYIWRWAVNNSDVDLMAHEMTTTVFCLSPAGDNCVSARFFSAVAAGCLPVVICDHLTGAFPNAVDYSSFWIKHKASEFVNKPLGLIERLRAMPADEILRRQQAMDRYRSHILYDAPPWTIGDHILRSANHCARKRLADPRIERCRVAAWKAAEKLANRTRAARTVGSAGSSRGAEREAKASPLRTAGSEACDCSIRSRSAACDFGKRCELSRSGASTLLSSLRNAISGKPRSHDGTKPHDSKAVSKASGGKLNGKRSASPVVPPR